MKQSIWEYQSIDALRKTLTDERVVLAGGCYDLIHFGHFTFLKRARELGSALVIALESDEHIIKFKGRTPFHSQSERAEILTGLEVVDHVILLPFFSEDAQYAELVKRIAPQIIAVTKPDKHIQNKRDHAEPIGAEVIEVMSVLPAFATRKIIERI